MSAWGLDVGEESVEQIGDRLMVHFSLVFWDREPFEMSRRGRPRRLFVGLISDSILKAEQLDTLGFYDSGHNFKAGEASGWPYFNFVMKGFYRLVCEVVGVLVEEDEISSAKPVS
jgi:hypothetical protein